jgi:hypothetical protein
MVNIDNSFISYMMLYHSTASFEARTSCDVHHKTGSLPEIKVGETVRTASPIPVLTREESVITLPGNGQSSRLKTETKPSLRFEKISIRKRGMNSGITGGGYQCC